MNYKHQQDLIDSKPTKRLIAFGCGCGKTRTVLNLAKQVGGHTLIIAPKTQVLDKTWEREMEETGITIPYTVVSKERFRKDPMLYKADILVLDESHCFVGVTAGTRYRRKIEIPRSSQLFEAVENWVITNKPKAIYLCSATPFPQPLAVYAIARLFGANWDYFAFRRKFYTYIPHIRRGIWVPKHDKATEEELVKLAKSFGTFGRLEDFADVPDQVHKSIVVGMSVPQQAKKRELALLYPEPIVRIGKKQQLEQGIFEDELVHEYKTAEIIELAKEFNKLLVFAKFTKQIDLIAAELKSTFKDRDILILDGRTVDRRALLEQAENPHRKTVVIAQSQISTGYELPSFRCTIFASMSYSFVDYQQAIGRTLRINAVAKNCYVYLLADEIDKAVYKCVKQKQDFSELLFLQNK